ncbi:MAG: zinc-ribbon domain-containing protein [Alphaproteobacteria bacterium]|nr:zinc-ribbon domain-containing protein [Alphaproteobacteria bacterium]
MKATCDFCKTEYSIDTSTRGRVRCAICGYEWIISPAANRGAWLTFIAAATAALAAIVFSVAVITRHQVRASAASRPLVATVTDIRSVIDAAGVPHFVVSGRVTNQSADIYGVPDLIIVSRDENGNEITRQKFMPSATLLDSGASVDFSHTLSAPCDGVKKITVELKDQMDRQ